MDANPIEREEEGTNVGYDDIGGCRKFSSLVLWFFGSLVGCLFWLLGSLFWLVVFCLFKY
jgi:hypothetical protein